MDGFRAVNVYAFRSYSLWYLSLTLTSTHHVPIDLSPFRYGREPSVEKYIDS